MDEQQFRKLLNVQIAAMKSTQNQSDEIKAELQDINKQLAKIAKLLQSG